jgi:hypothetical protein
MDLVSNKHLSSISWMKCRYVGTHGTSLFWNENGEQKVFGPYIFQEAENQVHMVREKQRVAQSRQKSYAEHRRRELSMEVRNFVYLKVSPMRGLHHFKVWGTLTPRFIGPFKILEKRVEVAYQLELPPQLSDVHDIFMSLNWRIICVCLNHKYPWKTWILKKIFLIKSTQNKRIKMCKVHWSHHIEEEGTWKREEEFKSEFPSFFFDPSKFQGWDSF